MLLDPRHRPRRAADDRHRLEVLGPRLLDRAPFDQRGLAVQPRQLQQRVDVGSELLPVEPRRPAEEQPLQRAATVRRPANEPVLEPGREPGEVPRGQQAMRSPGDASHTWGSSRVH